MTETKVFVIGIDAATFDLMGPWLEAGKLPHIRSVMDRGCSGVLESSMPPLSPVAWPSLYTGVNPGKHGIFDFVERAKSGSGISFLNRSHCKAQPLWRYLNKAGYRTGIVNVPMTFPPDPVDGFLVAGLDTPSVRSPFTYPPELKDDIIAAVGKYIIELEHSPRLMDDPIRYLEMMYEMIEVREKTVHYLMSRSPVDFFMVVFTATDRVQHTYWKYIDPQHPDHRPGLEDAILRVYERVDAAVGRLLRRIDPSASVLIVSDHGMNGIHKSADLNSLLREKGFLHLKDDPFSRAYDFYRRVKRRLLKTNEILWFDHFVDWKRTKAFHIGSWGNIYLNVKGRDPQGIVNPGNEYETVRESIAEELLRLRDPANGKQVIRAVKRKEEIFTGGLLAHAPDLVILWEDHYNCVKTVHENMRGRTRGLLQPCGVICADHHPDGIFIISSPQMKQGVRGLRARITDIAPTVLSLMNVEVPPSMDGRVLAELFEAGAPGGSGEKRSAGTGEDAPGNGGGEAAYSGEDAELIAERLRNLGYIE